MTKPLRVLIVENSENDALLILRELKRGGWEVSFERVETPEGMRRALQESYWDVVLADYTMPAFSALDALNILKETGLDLPFIIVSGSIGEEIAVAAMRAGAHDYIMKNNLTRLSVAVERELREAESRLLRMKAEQGLKESNQTLWALIKSSPLAIVSVDTQRNVTIWNPAAEKVFGWSEREVLGSTIPIVPKDKHPEFREVFGRALEGKPTTNLETQRKRKDGSLIDVSLTASALYDSTGRVVGAMGIFVDITDRKQAENILRQSEIKFRALAETTAAAIFIYQGTKMRYVNQAAERIVGYSREEFLRMDFWEIIHPDFQELVKQRGWARQRGEKVPARYEVKLKTKSGQERWVDFTAGVIDFEGKPAVLGTAVDITERKQMEERYRSIFENAVEGIFVTTADGRMLTANPALARMLGYASAEELLTAVTDVGRQLYANPSQREELLRMLRSKREARGFECELFRKDGRKIWASANVRAVQNKQRQIVRLEGVAQDITERKQAEEALKKNEVLLSKTQQIARLGGWELDLSNLEDIDKNELRWTDETFRIFGYEPGEVEVTNEFFFDRVHPEDRPKVEEVATRALAEKTSYGIEHRILLPDKTERVVHEHADILFDEKTGRPLRMYGTVQDITERKQAEKALLESEERFRQIAESITEVFWLTDPAKNQMIYISPAYEKIWGRSCASLYQNPLSWVDAVHPEDRQRVLEAAMTKQVKGEFHEEYRIVRPDGSIRWILDKAYPIRNDKGEVYRIAGIAEDVTKEKQLADQLRQVQKMDAVGQLAGGIAHDFNNLLTAVGGYSDFVLEQVAPDNPLRKDVEEIKKGTERATALTRQLLAFSRRQMMQPVVLNLNERVADMGGLLRRFIGEDIRLVTVCAPDLAPIKADPQQLEQIMMNLVLNARDAMPKGGQLTIETKNVELDEAFARQHLGSQPGAHVMLAVSDTGCGMDAEVQKHIFEPFFTTKEKGKGTGLGLSTVYGIVKQSGGYISVYSEPGRGSRFKIYLPQAVSAIPQLEVKTAPPNPAGGTETILLVEDEEAVRSLAAKMLRGKGYKVLEAGDGQQAQAVLKEHTGGLDLLVTDVVMPKMGGPELAKGLRSLHRRLKVLFMTGYTDHSAFQEGILPPGTALLQKPFSPRALAQKVREVLDGSKSAASLPGKKEKEKKTAPEK